MARELLMQFQVLSVKAILRRDTIRRDEWFSDSYEISDSLNLRGGVRMSYTRIDSKFVDETRMIKESLIISGCRCNTC